MTREEIKQNLTDYRTATLKVKELISTENNCLELMNYYKKKGSEYKDQYLQQKQILDSLKICETSKEINKYKKYADAIKTLPINLKIISIEWFVNGSSLDEIINKHHYGRQTVYNMINESKNEICNRLLGGK